MAKEVTSWQANDGSLHDNQCKAAVRDIELMVAASPLAENPPFAKKLSEWLASNSSVVRATLQAHAKACNKRPARKRAPPKPKGIVGVTVKAFNLDLVGHDPHCKARLSGFFRHCDCEHLSPEEIDGYKQQSDAAFPENKPIVALVAKG